MSKEDALSCAVGLGVAAVIMITAILNKENFKNETRTEEFYHKKIGSSEETAVIIMLEFGMLRTKEMLELAVELYSECDSEEEFRQKLTEKKNELDLRARKVWEEYRKN